MCLVALPMTSGDGQPCPVQTLLARTSADGCAIFPDELVSRLKLPSSLLSISAMGGLTSIHCSDCEAVLDLEISDEWDKSGFVTTAMPDSRDLVQYWTWPRTLPST